ncbi:MAG: kynureninase [Vicinamibacterales bacterium]
MSKVSRDDCLARDVEDPLAPLRAQFDLERVDQRGVIYLDGNSLGVLPKATAARVRQVIEDEWGVGLIRSWNVAGWITLSQRIADKIARLIGASTGEVIVADSTSLNLYKVLSAAIDVVKAQQLASPTPSGGPAARAGGGKLSIVSERSNFPTDLYIADTLARAHGLELVLVDAEEIPACFGEAAIVLITHVNYRTGRMHRMSEITRAAHEAGALMIWDLAHSAGAMPVRLHGEGPLEEAADFAIGCGYKYLNGGPGAPAFAWAHPRHIEWMDREVWRQPLSGWFGHAAPFDFTPDYRPAAGMSRFICGTPPVLSMAALECGVDSVLAADAHGGLEAIRRKSVELTELFIDLVESRCAGHGLSLVTPRNANQRGSQVGVAHATGGYAIMQALISRAVIGDFRAPDILRFGFTPLYTRFVDVWDAVDRLARVLESGEWREARFSVRAAVT